MADKSSPALVKAAEKRVLIKKGLVFKKVFGDRPDLCRKLVERALNIEVASVEVVQTERELEIGDEWRGGRVDLYVVDSVGNAYDIEMQTKRNDDEWLRARHYQALMDATFLQKGGKAKDLPQSVVIFICDFDPFGENERVYDCRTVCLQTGSVVRDGRRSVYLSATATGGEVSGELDAFLRYVHGRDVEGDDFVDEVRSVVHSCCEDFEWLEDFMTVEEYYESEVNTRVREAVDKAVSEAVDKAVSEAVEQNTIDTLAALVRDGLLDVAVAADRAGVNEGEMARLASAPR